MKSIVLQTLLGGNAAYATALGSDPAGGIKLYPQGKVPQGTKRPFAVFINPVSRTEDQNKDARGFVRTNVQIDQYGRTLDEAEDLDELCVNALNRYRGIVNGVNISSVRVISGNTGFNDNQESNRRTSEFSFLNQP
jgi:hypothetical protein